MFAKQPDSIYIDRMIRALTSLLWVVAALALGFEAVAQPCDLRADIGVTSAHEMMSDMPCHDAMMSMPSDDLPEHESQACCCAALLGNGVTANASELSQPIPGLTLWASPLPDAAASILLEYEPPPPRA